MARRSILKKLRKSQPGVPPPKRDEGFLPSPRISFGMIARNEESVIARCLESVKGVVDEMIVVDTGSTDRTAEVAQSLGARVVHHRWSDDFAEARNVCVREAKGDWLLVLDADESLDPASGAVIRQVAQRLVFEGKYCAYLLRVRNYLTGADEGGATGQATEHFVARLVPVHPDIFYAGVIHENVTHRAGPDRLHFVAITDTLIHHWGYTKEEHARKNRTGRNEPLLRRAVELRPEDPYVHYNWGVHLFGARRLDEALEEFRRCQALMPGSLRPPYLPTSCIHAGEILLRMGRLDEAAAAFTEALALSPGAPDALYGLGKVYEARGDAHAAAEQFEKALRSRGGHPNHLGTSDMSTATWKPCVVRGGGQAPPGHGKVPGSARGHRSGHGRRGKLAGAAHFSKSAGYPAIGRCAFRSGRWGYKRPRSR